MHPAQEMAQRVFPAHVGMNLLTLRHAFAFSSLARTSEYCSRDARVGEGPAPLRMTQAKGASLLARATATFLTCVRASRRIQPGYGLVVLARRVHSEESVIDL
jgi:hypothetical protein